MKKNTPRWVWDYDLDEEQFQKLLAGEITIGRLDQRWAAVRLLDYAPYSEIVRCMGFPMLVAKWSVWRRYVRSERRRRGLDFLVAWLPHAHPELV